MRMEMVCQEGNIPKLPSGSACRYAVSVRDSRVGHMEMFLPQVSAAIWRNLLTDTYFVLDGLLNFEPVRKWPVGVHV